MIILYILKKLW